VIGSVLTVADMSVVGAAVGCSEAVGGAVAAALLQPGLSAPRLGALPLLRCGDKGGGSALLCVVYRNELEKRTQVKDAGGSLGTVQMSW